MSTTENTILDQPAVCVLTPADPTCEQGWPCLACCDAMNVPEHGKFGISETTRSGFGTGTGSGRSTTVQPATEKQVAFLSRLVGEKLDPAAVTAEYLPILIASGKQGVSRAIDELMKLPRFVAEGEAPTFRWTKLDDQWFVRCSIPGLEVPVGEQITITKASGETAEAIVEASFEGKDGWLFRVRKVEAPVAKAAGEHKRGDVHVIDGDFYRIHIGQKSGNAYACCARILREAVWGEDENGKRVLISAGEVDWEYAPAMTSKLTDENRATPEQAHAFGEMVGKCCFCSRNIDTPESVERGYGPTCASKYGLPWG